MRSWASAAALILAPGVAMAADCNRPAPIQVAPGASATIASGPPSGSSDCYQITARGDQTLTLTLDSTTDDAVFALYAPGWTAKCDSAGDCDLTGDLLSEDGTSAWADTLQESGAYLIVIDNTASDSEYRLTAELQ